MDETTQAPETAERAAEPDGSAEGAIGSAEASSIACSPLSASPTTTTSLDRSRAAWSPSRVTGWSSTIKTRIAAMFS